MGIRQQIYEEVLYQTRDAMRLVEFKFIIGYRARCWLMAHENLLEHDFRGNYMLLGCTVAFGGKPEIMRLADTSGTVIAEWGHCERINTLTRVKSGITKA